jgi:hypothetical protein
MPRERADGNDEGIADHGDPLGAAAESHPAVDNAAGRIDPLERARDGIRDPDLPVCRDDAARTAADEDRRVYGVPVGIELRDCAVQLVCDPDGPRPGGDGASAVADMNRR